MSHVFPDASQVHPGTSRTLSEASRVLPDGVYVDPRAKTALVVGGNLLGSIDHEDVERLAS
jgi:hypothetical protein